MIRTLWDKYRPIILYLVFGATTTVINILTYALCYDGRLLPGVLTLPSLGLSNVPSNIIAWALSVAVAYLTNKLWVFDSKSFAPAVLLPELWKFVSCRLATGVMDLAIMWVGVDLLQGPGTPIKLGSNVLVIVLNYVFSKLLIFKKTER